MSTVDRFLDPPSPSQRYLVRLPQPWDYWRLRMESDTAWEVAEVGTGRTVSPPGALTRGEAELLRQKMESAAIPQ